MKTTPTWARFGQGPRIGAMAALLLAPFALPALAHAPLDRAIEESSRRIATAADPARELLRRGEFHRLAGQWDEARTDYDRVAALHPDLPGLRLCRAALLADQGRFADARALLDEVIEKESDEPRARQLRARVWEALGRPEAAAEDLRRAIDLSRDPKPDLFVERSRLLTRAGLRTEALHCLEDGVGRLGSIASLELAAADLQLELGDRDGALVRIDRVAAQMENPGVLLDLREEILAAARSSGVVAAMPASMLLTPPTRSPEATLHRAGSRVTTQVVAGSAGPLALAAVDTFVTRGPYLQVGTPTGVTIRWRTDKPSSTRVWYGTALGSLTSSVQSAAPVTDHEITIRGASAATKHYYAVGTIANALAGGDASFSFVTSPAPGTPKPMRVWILGDPGTANTGAARVRDAFAAYNAGHPVDVWLMLGDNAYNAGTDDEYQAAVFDMYPTFLKNTVLWPTRGNHDQVYSAPTLDYYDIFSMPTAGEAGGLASGTEAYYSYDVGNIHFICLDSEGSGLNPNDPMANWLRTDIAATARDWVIAFWHHPPYSKGSHDSDSESQLIDMRANILPILEATGVDLVLTGHSHSYERSFLLDRYYGDSGTLTGAMKIDAGDGRESGTGAYRKPTSGTSPHEGAVYTVCGSSGSTGGGSLDHPAMISSLDVLGSMVLDVNGGRLDARFLDDLGAIRDSFTMIKGAGEPVDVIRPAAILDLATGSSPVAPASGRSVGR